MDNVKNAKAWLQGLNLQYGVTNVSMSITRCTDLAVVWYITTQPVIDLVQTEVNDDEARMAWTFINALGHVAAEKYEQSANQVRCYHWFKGSNVPSCRWLDSCPEQRRLSGRINRYEPFVSSSARS